MKVLIIAECGDSFTINWEENTHILGTAVKCPICEQGILIQPTLTAQLWTDEDGAPLSREKL